MLSMDVNPKSGMTLPVTLISAYNEYVSVGYPADTAIYILRVAENTLEKMSRYFENNVSFIPSVSIDTYAKTIFFGEHSFRVEIDNNLRLGHIVFGPELITIRWSGK